jgi:hypothetical protein
MKDLVIRPKYFSLVKPFINTSLIKVFIGQRRVGKSCIMKQIRDDIRSNTEGNIIYIDKEDEEFNYIKTSTELSQYINDNVSQNKDIKNYIFIDEIQEIQDFENSIRSFAAKPNFDIYISGSNSEILSGELAGRLSGRYIEIPVYSLDYTEFLEFHKLSSDSESLNKYLRYGGLPFLKHLQLDDDPAFEYLKNIFTSILYRDVISRYSIRNANFLDRLIHYAADNIGNILNAKKISDYLKSHKTNISVNSVLDYLSHLVNSQIIIPVKRYDIKGKRIFEIGEKYYFQDLGIRNAINGYRVGDIGKIIENAVANYLVSHGYSIFTGDWQTKEIDFIAMKNNEKVYIQVAYLLNDPSTIDREFGNLQYIDDNYPKMVISMDSQTMNTIDGIEHWNLLNFLEKFG